MLHAEDNVKNNTVFWTSPRALAHKQLFLERTTPQKYSILAFERTTPRIHDLADTDDTMKKLLAKHRGTANIAY